jgi:hypothetical protein
MSSIEIPEVPELDSQEELEEYDSVLAYHGATHRFRDAMQEYGIVPGTDLMPLEGQTTDQSMVYLGPETGDEVEEMEVPSVEMYSDAENYATRSVKDTVGGKPMIVETSLPVDNLVADDVSQVDMRGVETPYDSITQYATVGHEGKVLPEDIEDFHVLDKPALPPWNNSAYKSTGKDAEFISAMAEPDIEKMEEMGEPFQEQIDPREFAGEENITPNELLKNAHPELF